MSKNADLNNPEKVNEYIANLQKTGNYKQKLTQVYAKFLEYQNVEYKRPYYHKDAKPIKIPTHEKLQMIIANSGKTMATKLTLSLETGLRPVELQNLKVKDIDLEQKAIYPTTAKHGSARILRMSNSLTTRIQEHIIRNSLNQNDQLFKGNAVRYGKEYRKTRNRLAKKLKEPSIQTIRLYDFRHYFATMLYQKTKDILYVKQQMGHKRIETTLIYTQLLASDREEEYTCKTATNTKQATELIEHGFQYVSEIDGTQLYRKRK